MLFRSPKSVINIKGIINSTKFFIILIIPFILITDLGNIRSKLPIFNKRTKKANILGGIIIFFIISMSVSMVDGFKSQEQKQFDTNVAQKSKERQEAKKIGIAFNEKIKILGDLETITYDEADNVSLMRKEYDALTLEQKEFITDLPLLESIEKKIGDMVQEIARALDNKIKGVGAIESLTLEKSKDISLIRNEYEALTQKQKDYVTEIALLELMEKRMEDLVIEVPSVLDQDILALGDVAELTYDKADLVGSLRTEYNQLSLEQKELVTELALLESAENKIKELKVIVDKKIADEKAEADKKAAEEKLAADQRAEEARAAEEYQKWIERQFSVWDGSNRHLVKLVKENLNDPKSFKHAETEYWDKGDHIIVKMSYRAKNAFGGLVLQNVTAKVDYKTQYISVISQND